MERREYNSRRRRQRRAGRELRARRAGGVFVCTPAKCGTTWMQSIVAGLLWPTSDLARSRPRDRPVDRAEDRCRPPEMRAQLQRWRIVASWRRPTPRPTASAGLDEARYVFVGRDGRDAACQLLRPHRELPRRGPRHARTRSPPRACRYCRAWTAISMPSSRAGASSGRRPLLHPPRDLLGRAPASGISPMVHYNDPRADLAGEMRRSRRLPRRRRPGCELARGGGALAAFQSACATAKRASAPSTCSSRAASAPSCSKARTWPRATC